MLCGRQALLETLHTHFLTSSSLQPREAGGGVIPILLMRRTQAQRVSGSHSKWWTWNLNPLCLAQERSGSVRMEKKQETGTALVAQWLRIRLPMHGTRVQALVWEDPTCHGATKPVHHNY